MAKNYRQCYVPDVYDQAVADEIGVYNDVKWNKHIAAAYRALYDRNHVNNPLPHHDTEAAVKLLKQFVDAEPERENRRVLDNVVRRAYNNVKKLDVLKDIVKEVDTNFTVVERQDRTRLLADMFTSMMTAFEKKYGASRDAMMGNGAILPDGTLVNEDSIWEDIRKQLLTNYVNLLNAGDERYKAYNKMLVYFTGLRTMARMRLSLTEGLRLFGTEETHPGDDVDGAVPASLYGTKDLLDLYNPEESTAEHWAVLTDSISSFASLSRPTRAMLSRLPQYDGNGEIIVDDLGFPRTLDMAKAHRRLSDVLVGIIDENDMLNTLVGRSGTSARDLWMRDVSGALRKDSELRTTFWSDFHKNLQLYSETQDNLRKGYRSFTYRILNRERGGSEEYLASLAESGAGNSIFGKDGNVNHRVLESVLWSIDRTFDIEPISKGAKGVRRADDSYVDESTMADPVIAMKPKDRASFIWDMAQRFGVVKMTRSDAARIARDSRMYMPILRALIRFRTEYAFSGKVVAALEHGQKNNDAIKIKSIDALLRSMLDAMKSVTEMTEYETTALRKNGKGKFIRLDSIVTPSYLGDFVDRIHRYSTSGGKNLIKFISNKYFDSSAYLWKRESGEQVILNKWLADMCGEKRTFKGRLVGNMAQRLRIERFTGGQSKDFEGMVDFEDIMSSIGAFVAKVDGAGFNRSGFARYPVFILGDSNIRKYITAPHYEMNGTLEEGSDVTDMWSPEIVEGMMKVARSEMRRMEQTKSLKKSGVEMQNISEHPEEFSFFPFLNEGFRDSDGKPLPQFREIAYSTGMLTETSVSEAIRAYMKYTLTQFMQKLESMGAFATGGRSNYPLYFKDILKTAYGNNTLINVDKAKQLVVDYFWNQKFSTMMQLHLLAIDPAFYNGTKDLQKRFKEVHSSGISLSSRAEYNGEKFCDEDGVAEERCVYFDDISMSAEENDPEFCSALKKYLPDVYEQYSKNSLTDGQAYRSLPSYRKMLIMAGGGRWTKAMESTYQKIMALRKTYPDGVPPEEIAQISDEAVRFQPVKPMMYTTENVTVGDEVMKVPVYHKYAEIPIIPEFLPEGSKLRAMAEWMEANDVDLALSTKAVKVGGFGSVDIKDADNAKSLGDALDKATVHRLSLADLRIQVGTPVHRDDLTKIGTQLKKIIMGGIDLNGNYSSYAGSFGSIRVGKDRVTSKLTGSDVLSLFNQILMADTLEDAHAFIRQFGNRKDVADAVLTSMVQDGDITFEAMRSLTPSYDGVTRRNELGFELTEPGTAMDSQQYLLSLYRKQVNQQKMSGGSLIQASAMGLKSFDTTGDLHVIEDSEGRPIEVEVEVPWDLHYTDVDGSTVNVPYEDYVNTDGTLKIKDKGPDAGKALVEIDFPGSTNFLANRIPTERMYSILNCRVKRFTRPEAGMTIKVPLEWTTVAGFDFDIDKLYFLRKSYGFIYNKVTGKRVLDAYDPDKLPSENSRRSRDNFLLDLMLARLRDPRTMKERLTPGGFTNSSDAALKMRILEFGDPTEIREGYDFGFLDSGTRVNLKAVDKMAEEKKDPEPNLDPTDPWTMVYYNKQNQVAQKLIGIFANHLTNFSIASNCKTFGLKTPIAFAGHSYGDFLHFPDGVDVAKNVAELVAAAVDAVKDPVLNYLNFNEVTADIAAVLIRLGYSPYEIGLLLRQPVIVHICEVAQRDNVPASVALTHALEEMSKEWGYSDYMDKSGKIAEPRADRLGIQQLADGVYGGRLDRETGRDWLSSGENTGYGSSYTDTQYNAALLFNQLLKASSDVSKFVLDTKWTSSNAVQSSLGAMAAKIDGTERWISEIGKPDGDSSLIIVPGDDVRSPLEDTEDDVFVDVGAYVDKYAAHPFGAEQAMWDATRKCVEHLMSFYPYDSKLYKGMRSALGGMTRGGVLNGRLTDKMNAELPLYILSNLPGSSFDGEQILDFPVMLPSGATVYTNKEDGRRTLNAEETLKRDENGSFVIEDDNTVFDADRWEAETLNEGGTRSIRMTRREYYRKWFPYEVLRYKLEEDAKEHKIASSLIDSIEYDVDRNGFPYIRLNTDVGEMQTYRKAEITEAWLQLYKEGDDYQKQLAGKLVMYNVMNWGFSYNQKSFFHLAPVEVKQNLVVIPKGAFGPISASGGMTYKRFWQKLTNQKNVLDLEAYGGFSRQFVLNNAGERSFVTPLYGDAARDFGSLADMYAGETITFDIGTPLYEGISRRIVRRSVRYPDGTNVTYISPLLKVDDRYYIADGDGASFNAVTDGVAKYVEVTERDGLNLSSNVTYHRDGADTSFLYSTAVNGEEEPPSADDGDGNDEGKGPAGNAGYGDGLLETRRDEYRKWLHGKMVEAGYDSYDAADNVQGLSDEQLFSVLNETRTALNLPKLTKFGEELC